MTLSDTHTPFDLSPLHAKAHELAAAEKAEYGMPDPHQIHQVLARYFPRATFDECYDAAMRAYMAHR